MTPGSCIIVTEIINFQSAKQVDGSSMGIIVCNLKDGGRCHMVAAAVMDIPRPRRRTICGWRFGSGVSLAASITSVKGGALCRRCFPKGVIQEEGYMSPIEDYD